MYSGMAEGLTKEGIDFVPNIYFGVIRCSVAKQEDKILGQGTERGEEERAHCSASVWSKGLTQPAIQGFSETPASTNLWRMRDAKSLECVQGRMKFLPLEP